MTLSKKAKRIQEIEEDIYEIMSSCGSTDSYAQSLMKECQRYGEDIVKAIIKYYDLPDFDRIKANAVDLGGIISDGHEIAYCTFGSNLIVYLRNIPQNYCALDLDYLQEFFKEHE